MGFYEWVIDLYRMDCMLVLSLPCEVLRLQCVCRTIHAILRQHMSIEHRSLLDKLLSMPPSQALQVIQRSQSPETDTPLSEGLSEMIQSLQSCDSSSFNLLHCLHATVASSEGWSYREVVSLVHSIQSQVLGSERSVLEYCCDI